MPTRRNPLDALSQATSIGPDRPRQAMADGGTPMQAGMPSVKGMVGQLVDELGRSLGPEAFSPAQGALGLNEFAPVSRQAPNELLEAAKRFGIPVDRLRGLFGF